MQIEKLDFVEEFLFFVAKLESGSNPLKRASNHQFVVLLFSCAGFNRNDIASLNSLNVGVEKNR